MFFLNRQFFVATFLLGQWLFPTSAGAQSGVPVWTNSYHGPGFGSDWAYATAFDASNSIFITGSSCGILTNNDIVTVKYSSDGNALWTNRYSTAINDGPDQFGGDIAYAVALDTNGDAYVVGQAKTGSSTSQYGFLTLKYSSIGSPIWTNLFASSSPFYSSVARSVALDKAGNACVTGHAPSPGGPSLDCVTLKYSSVGVPLWTNHYNGPGNNSDMGRAIKVDGNDNVVVTGYSASTNASPYNFDFLTIKYSSSGLPQWTNRYDGDAHGSDQASALALGQGGNVFVTGTSFGAASSNDFLTIKYSAAGVPLWTNRYDGPAHADDAAYAIALDTNGNIFVTGYSSGIGTSYDYATIAYSSAGVPIWTNRYNGLSNGIDIARSIAIDQRGNIFVTGSESLEGDTTSATIAYSNSGVPLWTNRDLRGLPQSVAVDSDGGVCVTGPGIDPTISSKYLSMLTVKYSPTHAPPPALQIEDSFGSAILSWSDATFVLQSTASLTDSFTNIPSATSPYTNAISGPKQFFRLKAN